MKTKPVYEVVVGTLKEGVSLEAYLGINNLVEADLRKMPGYRSRKLLAGTDGLVIDLVLWESLEQALHAAEIFPTFESAQPMGEMLDFSSVKMYHLEQVYADEITPA